MNPPHKLFFSSLKQVEKRLKLDDQNPPPPPSPADNPQPHSDQNPPSPPSPSGYPQPESDQNPPPPPAGNPQPQSDQNPPSPPSTSGNPQPQSDQNPPSPSSPADQTETTATGSPIYLHNTSSTLQVNTEQQRPPQEFLSDEFQSSPQFQSEDLGIRVSEITAVNDVDSMMRLLGLTDSDGKGSEVHDFGDDEFYDKIVKVKGPKCKKEVERLNGWIKYFLRNGRNEPLRLTHLLLAKASFVSSDNQVDLDFPSTIDDFLHNDPPLE